MAKSKSIPKPVTIDPSLTHNVTLGWPLLEETLHAIASKADGEAFKYAMQALWMAEKLGPEINAAHENAEAVHERDRIAEEAAA